MSRIFDHFNKEGSPCPLCGTNEDKKCILIPIMGTEQGSMAEAEAVHVDCISEFAVCTKSEDTFAIMGYIKESE